MKIATHDSGTGEKSKNFLHRQFELFAKTQTKTIEEQWSCGVRYFDLRIDKNLCICHGLWKANKDLFDILSLLEYLSCKSNEDSYYTITVENNFKGVESFIESIKDIRHNYSKTHCVCINRKKPEWKTIYKFLDVPIRADYISVPSFNEYSKFTFKKWKKYIPIPKVLNKNYTRKYKFNNNFFVMVDFI